MAIKPTVTTLYLIRHGSTDFNRDHRYQGKTDLPLSVNGREQTRELKKRVRYILFDHVLVSPAKRSQETYQLLFGSKKPITVHKGLTEINFGVWEGLTYKEIQSNYPKQLLHYEQNPLTYAPNGAETFTVVFERIKTLHRDIFSTYRGKTIAILGHGGSINIFLCYLFDIKPQTPWQFNLQPASLTKILIYPNNKVVMEL